MLYRVGDRCLTKKHPYTAWRYKILAPMMVTYLDLGREGCTSSSIHTIASNESVGGLVELD